MQVGESKSLRADNKLAESFTYTRLPDAVINTSCPGHLRKRKPGIPTGTKEIRYYLQATGCTYLIGDSGTQAQSTGAITEEL